MSAITQNMHSNLVWLEQGDVVFRAQVANKPFSRAQLFKVPKDVISKESLGLKKILNESRKQRLQVYADCPVILVDEDPDNLELVLAVICYGIGKNSVVDYDTCLPFSTVVTMLHMGVKYRVDLLRNEAGRRLSKCFPSILEEYNPRLFSDPSRNIRGKLVDVSRTDAFEVIRLAHQYRLHFLLPAAYYVAAQLPMRELFLALETNQIPMIDFKRIVCAYTSLQRLSVHVVEEVLWQGPAKTCITHEMCRSKLNSLVSLAIRDSYEISPGPKKGCLDRRDVLESLMLQVYDCADCRAHVMAQHDTGRSATWDQLKTIFGLEDSRTAEGDMEKHVSEREKACMNYV
ncbi:unnamed protein product [Somion occarium]|uniref:Uncharacterized protein n=1 Tax=Somion occarium TaxID=3059160 RepID=A0ABP1EB05_9APHY